jgi:hypothetical protein
MQGTPRERCKGCGRRIEADETPCVHTGRIFCPACWGVVNDAPPPVPVIRPPNFAGWLVLPAVGMVFAPLLELAWAGNLSSEIQEVRRAGIIHQFPAATALDTAAILWAWLMFFGRIAAAVLFFQKRAFVPTMMIWLYVVGIAESVGWTLALVAVFGSPAIQAADVAKMLMMIGISAIWITYFSVSLRVRATFIRKLGQRKVPVTATRLAAPKPQLTSTKASSTGKAKQSDPLHTVLWRYAKQWWHRCPKCGSRRMRNYCARCGAPVTPTSSAPVTDKVVAKATAH